MVTIIRGVPLSNRPGPGRPPGYRKDLRIPAWMFAILAGLALLLFMVLATSLPVRLAETRLDGVRTLAGRACIVVAADMSGSMSAVSPERQKAVAMLLPWLKANLRADDQVMLVNFTDQAALVMPVTSVAHLSSKTPDEEPLDGGGTSFEPAVGLVAEELAGQRCGAVEILAITDGVFSDDPDALAVALAKAGVTRMHVLNPNGAIRESPLDQAALAGVDVRALGDGDQMSLTFGSAIADLTGQKLSKT